MDKIDKRRKENPRKKYFQMRLNNDEEEILDSLSVITDESKADVIRNALKIYYEIKRAGGNY